jgi:hypothetical protein
MKTPMEFLRNQQEKGRDWLHSGVGNGSAGLGARDHIPSTRLD